MKSLTISILTVLTALFFVGCDNDNDVVVVDFTPAAPQGVYSVTGNGEVEIYWVGPYESDIVAYIVWRSFDPITDYREIGTVNAEANPRLDYITYMFTDDNVTNGVTYYYAVSSVDKAGQVSELSAENVFDTPRPEGLVELVDSLVSPLEAGFNLEAAAVVSSHSTIADIFIDRVPGFDNVFYINAADLATDIQDVGYTYDFDEIGWAPEFGWSENGFLEIIEEHTYVIWTRDYHFAKMRVESVNVATGSVVFRWAYQTDEDNPELKPVVMEKPVHGPEYLTKEF